MNDPAPPSLLIGPVTEAMLLALALAIALWLRPWRLLAGTRLLTPLLAVLAVLPWLWALPALHPMPLQLRWSGACLAVLLLGWPLAVPALLGVALIATAIAPALSAADAVDIAFWQGLLPATGALAVGAVLRWAFGPHLFIYLLGRAFFGTVGCVFFCGLLQAWNSGQLATLDPGLSVVGRWLMAWGDGVITGMITTLFVAYRPQWLATWSDTLYLKKKR